MKLNVILVILLSLFGCSPAFADVIIKGKSTENIEFYAGSTKAAELDNTGTLTLPAGKTLTNVGGSNPPGMVPIGGMVAIMPSTHANAWQPPATNFIKDGFMRADGGTVPTCADCIIPAGTVLPNMVGSFAKGTSTTTGTATAYGIAFVGTGAARSGWFGSTGLAASFSGTAAAYSVSVPAHYHNTFSLTAAGQAINIETGDNKTLHSHGITSGTTFGTPGSNEYYLGTGTGKSSGTESAYHKHQVVGTASASSVTGTVGNQGGSNGDLAFGASGTNTPAGTISFNTANDNMADWAAAGNYTPTGTMLGDPANVTVIWVIRVK
jgi:hypothetical protein